MPSRDGTFSVVSVAELGAHAVGLPYLSYLLEESQTAALLAREGCCAVRIPLAERFAVHKLIVSRLKTDRSTKSEKDVLQAAVVFAALGENHPGAIDDAVRAVPKRARRYARASLPLVQRCLQTSHPRAWDELAAAMGGATRQ